MAKPTPRALVRTQKVMEAYRLAPDGQSLVYALRVTADDDAYHTHLWRVRWSGGAPRRLTHGAVRDSSPAIAPDGRLLAFVRTPVGPDEPRGQVWLLPLDGGEPWQLTRLEHGVSSVAWSPDGRTLALLAPAGEHRFLVGTERPGKAPTARRITRLDFRDDEAGHLGRRSHLWIVAAGGGRPRQLTTGDFDVASPAWSPNGSQIAFSADPGPDANIAPRSRIFTVDVGGGDAAELVALAGDAGHPAWSPDGRRLAFIGTDVEDPPDHIPPSVWVVDVDGGRAGGARCLTADLDLPVGAWAWCDLAMAEDVPGPLWLDDASLLVLVGHRGRNLPYRITLDGAPEPLLEPDDRVVGGGVAHAEGRIALSAAVDGAASEVYALEGKRLRALTRDGSAWQRRFPLFRLEELEVAGPAGAIQVWLASPPDAGDERRPLILHLHGGPTGAWGASGSVDGMLLCAAGYRVAMPNIRGSATFGAEWVRALSGRWGQVDAEDALAVVDHLVGRGLTDRRGLGVMGLSYGGFLTQWLIGATDRFAAAVAENGVSNQVSVWANSYFGVHYNRRAGLADPLSDEGMTRLWSSSPLRQAARIRTPLLLLQAEEDRICPPADNEQLFTALKVLGRETEYILYPEEHHEMKNYGRPDRRIDRMRRTLDWFDRFLR